MTDPLPLVRDVLDKQVIDVNGLKVGKVDGIVLQLRRHRPPRVAAIELDMATLWRRVWHRAGDWIDAFQRWIAPNLVGPTRIQFEHVVRSGIDVEVDIDASRTNAFVWENWLDEHVVELLPGGGGRGEKD